MSYTNNAKKNISLSSLFQQYKLWNWFRFLTLVKLYYLHNIIVSSLLFFRFSSSPFFFSDLFDFATFYSAAVDDASILKNVIPKFVSVQDTILSVQLLYFHVIRILLFFLFAHVL